MRTAKAVWMLVLCGVGLMASTGARAVEVVTYTLEDVVLEEAEQMFGTFTWTYTDPEEFENGEGVFTYLDIPFTWHDHTDLDAMFDVGNSIEIVLDGSVHDDGVDITLFLEQPLTPTSGSPIDLTRSRYEIGGNGFHTGYFISGEIAIDLATGIGGEDPGLAKGPHLSSFPNPFNPSTILTYTLARSSKVSLSVHDALGREIANLVDAAYLEAGSHSASWNGRDSFGNALGSGIYIARLEAGELRTSMKLLLLQ